MHGQARMQACVICVEKPNRTSRHDPMGPCMGIGLSTGAQARGQFTYTHSASTSAHPAESASGLSLTRAPEARNGPVLSQRCHTFRGVADAAGLRNSSARGTAATTTNTSSQTNHKPSARTEECRHP